MDITSLSIGVFLFAVFMLPVVYLLIHQKANKNRTLKNLNEIASNNQLHLDRAESFGDFSLGLDSSNRKLIVMEYDSKNSKIIDLKKVNHVRIAKKSETSFSGNIKKEKLVQIALELEGNKRSSLAQVLFYNEDDYASTDADIRLNEAKRWEDLIQKNLPV